MGNKPGQTIDTKDMDPQELNSFRNLFLESITVVKNIAQAYPNSENDNVEYLKRVPDLISAFRKMREFAILRPDQSDLAEDTIDKGKKKAHVLGEDTPQWVTNLTTKYILEEFKVAQNKRQFTIHFPMLRYDSDVKEGVREALSVFPRDQLGALQTKLIRESANGYLDMLLTGKTCSALTTQSPYYKTIILVIKSREEWWPRLMTSRSGQTMRFVTAPVNYV